MAKKWTQEDFIREFYKRNPNANNIEILSPYISNKRKVICRCKIDGIIWFTTPNALLRPHGCPTCGNQKKSSEFFKKEMKNKKPNIIMLTEYVDANTKIFCKCKIDGYEWSAKPNDLLNSKNGCPKCSGKIKNKTTEYFKQELAEKNPNIEVLGEYEGNKTPIYCKCKVCGYKWSPRPNDLLSGHSCSKCNTSKGENKILSFLNNKNIENEYQYRFKDCKFKNILSFDFYLPNKKIAIEYDGEDHYIIFTRNKNETYEQAMDRFIDRKIRDTVKNIYCQQNNIKLIRIPYWDFNNIEEILIKELNL